MHRRPRRVSLLADSACLCLRVAVAVAVGAAVGTAAEWRRSAGSPTLAFSAPGLDIFLGDSTTLTWSSTGATSCTASGSWSGSRSTFGSQSVTPPQGSPRYSLTCSGQGGSVTQNVQLTVSLAPPPTLELTVSPESASPNEPIALTWTTTGADACHVPGTGPLPTAPYKARKRGSRRTTRPARATYEMQCEGRVGSRRDLPRCGCGRSRARR